MSLQNRETVSGSRLINRRSLLKGGAISAFAGATSLFGPDVITAIEDRAKPPDSEYRKYIEDYPSIDLPYYYTDRFIGHPKINSIQGADYLDSETHGDKIGFAVDQRRFVSLGVNSSIDPNYSIGLFRVNLSGSEVEDEGKSYILPVIQTPFSSDAKMYFGFLPSGDYEVEIEALENELYPRANLSSVEVFTVEGNDFTNINLEQLGNLGMRSDIVDSNKLIENVPLTSEVRIRYSPERNETVSEYRLDLSGEYGGKEPKDRIQKGDKRAFDSEPMVLYKINEANEIVEGVYQSAGHNITYLYYQSPYSLNIDRNNNMFASPRHEDLVVNLFPFNLIPGSYLDLSELNNAKKLLSVLEESYRGRIDINAGYILNHLAAIPNLSRVLDHHKRRLGLN